MKLNELLKEKRIKKKLSTRDVGKALGISKSTISRIENNENLNPNNKNVQRLLNFYSINYYEYIIEEYKRQNNIESTENEDNSLSPIHQMMIDMIKDKDQKNKKLRYNSQKKEKVY